MKKPHPNPPRKGEPYENGTIKKVSPTGGDLEGADYVFVYL